MAIFKVGDLAKLEDGVLEETLSTLAGVSAPRNKEAPTIRDGKIMAKGAAGQRGPREEFLDEIGPFAIRIRLGPPSALAGQFPMAR